MAAVQPRSAFLGPSPSHSQAPLPSSAFEPDFFASFDLPAAGNLPNFDSDVPLSFPAVSSSSSSSASAAQPAVMDAHRAPQFDPAALDQWIANAPSFLPDLEVPSGGGSDFLFAAGETDHYSTGSSPRDDQSHTSGDHDAPLKSASGTIIITPEEREMLAASGVVIPTDAITLTKAEEKALKSVRRRLRNKISAQDSRRKKKEYVDGLEQRVASCTAVNIEMQSKVSALAQENRTLRQQLQQLKEMVMRLGGPQSAATTGTILMVLALSFSMFVNPLSSSANATAAVPDMQVPGPAARTLKAIHVAPFGAADAQQEPTALSLASLRDTLSSLLFSPQQPQDQDDEQRRAGGPPSLAPLRAKPSARTAP